MSGGGVAGGPFFIFAVRIANGHNFVFNIFDICNQQDSITLACVESLDQYRDLLGKYCVYVFGDYRHKLPKVRGERREQPARERLGWTVFPAVPISQ